MRKEELIQIIDNLEGKKIGVVGDLMLDQFIWGDTNRISPEAPVPVVLAKKQTVVPGGAGNTANNIAALRGKPFIIGIRGQDRTGEKLIRAMKKKGINTESVFEEQNRPTIQKTRIIAGGQHVVRIDRENTEPINSDLEKKILEFVDTGLSQWEALIISDYAKGLLTESLAQNLIGLAKKHKKLTVGDTKPQNASFFKGVDLLIPNRKEALKITGAGNVESAGEAIQEKLGCNTIITQGSEGMTLFEENKMRRFPTKAQEIYDVSGAGDTVVAGLALSLVSGADLEQAAIIANHAAGIVVGKLGTAVVSPEELKKDIRENG